MALLPTRQDTAFIIDQQSVFNYARPYLGMSAIGDDCSRKLWYGLHWVSKIETTARTNRIFDLGHESEKIMIQAMKKIGLHVFRIDKDGNEVEMTGERGEEQEELVGFAGHARGHNDGRVRYVIEAPKTDHLLELKSSNDKNFKLMVKNGLKESNGKYYGQCQRYMHELKLTRTLFCMINKNDGSLYFERIAYDKEYAQTLVDKERDIIMSDVPMTRAFTVGFYKCNYCDYEQVCHHGAVPEKNCRTCEYGDLELDYKWKCGKSSKELSFAEQEAGCNLYRRGWGL